MSSEKTWSHESSSRPSWRDDDFTLTETLATSYKEDIECQFYFAGLLRHATPNRWDGSEISLYLTPLSFEEGW